MKKPKKNRDLGAVPLVVLMATWLGCAGVNVPESEAGAAGGAGKDGRVDDAGVAEGGDGATAAGSGHADAQGQNGDSVADGAAVPDGTREEPCGTDEFRNRETGQCVATEVQWVAIPGGSFEMGIADGDSWEMPKAQGVEVAAFDMTRTEVTVVQYRECVAAGACTEPGSCDLYNNWEVSGRQNHPVNCVAWDQAAAFCAWADGRLPSEAEWEYAARGGGKDVDYPWGDEKATCEFAVMTVDNEHGCEKHRTWEVCGKPAGSTEQGLCDMAGNVWEWVEDDFHSSYSGIPADGTAWVDDPRSATRIKRGGALSSSFNLLRAAYRSVDPPSRQTFGVGFRCAR